MFILKIKTKKNLYLYDVNSNNFLKVDSKIWDNIEDYQNLDKDIKKKVDELKTNNIFLKPKVKRFLRPNKKYIYKKINDEMNQLILNITEECNFRCLYCSFSNSYPEIRNHTNRSMSISTAKKAVDYFFEHNKKADQCFISFYGGEPLLEFDKIKFMVNYIINNKTKNPLFAMTINGSLLNDEIMKFLVKHNFILSISLDGPQDIHDRYRKNSKGENTFNNIYINLLKFYKNFPKYCTDNITFISTNCPPYRYNELVDFFHNPFMKNFKKIIFNNLSNPTDIFFRQVGINMDDGLSSYADIFNMYLKNKTSKSMKKILRYIFDKDYLIIHNREMNLLEEEISINGICIPSTTRLFCSVDGLYYACEKIDEKLSIGNINQGVNVEKIIEYINKYIEISEENCIKCEYQRFCKLCFVSAIKNGELSKTVKDEVCKSAKIKINNNIIEYLEIMENNPEFFNHLRKQNEKYKCSN